jgi:transcriptional regulator with XRE-family HTH domain
MSGALLEQVRHAAGLTQDDLAVRVGTSRTTLSAYEHGRKSPTLATVERIVAGAGFTLCVEPLVSFREMRTRRGRPFFVPDRLWRLPVAAALATVTLPLELNWSQPGARWSLADRRERARCYEVVLVEGRSVDLASFVDGALLVDVWGDLVLPAEIRQQWEPIVGKVLAP